MKVREIYGVDFSGAKAAGRNIWVARTTPAGGKLRLESLDSLENICGTFERDLALAALVGMIQSTQGTLWGIDFPFGLPIEIFPAGTKWVDQLQSVSDWPGAVNAFGIDCCVRAKKLGGAMHIRRATDRQTSTPFDCYHYRIIYQTFHGMRDVLAPLARDASTAILPFHYDRLERADRVVVESCPGSTLRRLKLPHNNYKQPTGGPLTAKRRATRKILFEAIRTRVDMTEAQLRVLQRNPGGDAFDAVVAAVGVWDAWRRVDHPSIASDHRYPLEGHVFC